MEVSLKLGQALVLVGPQGTGKSTAARRIAEKHGAYAEIDVHVLDSDLELGAVLAGEPKTLIVGGLPARKETLVVVKQILTNDKLRAHRKCQEPKIVKTPNIIFCTGSTDPLGHIENSHRFSICRLGA